VHGPLGGEKGCGEKKTGDDDTRCFMKHRGGMEQRGGLVGRGGCQVEEQGEGSGRPATARCSGGGHRSGGT
jgi:hypothetical protein